VSPNIIVRAPGKLFLIGEYAVLDGCPGVVAAVDRAATVTLARDARPGTVQILAPGIAAIGNYRLDSLPPAAGTLRFPLAALLALRPERREALSEGIALTIASNLSESAGAKIGLGSSAAVTVAVAAALLAAAGVDIESEAGRNEVFSATWQAHRDAQGGVGSGADVAASVFGGLVSLTLRDGELPLVQRLDYSRELIFLAAATGRSASTVDLVAKYRSLNNGHARRRSTFVQRSIEHVERFLAHRDQPSGVLDALRAANTEILRLAADTGLELLTPELRQAIDIAERHGAAAKISGAGGGDCAIACTTDRRVADRICSDWSVAGLQPLPLSIDTKGASIARLEAFHES